VGPYCKLGLYFLYLCLFHVAAYTILAQFRLGRRYSSLYSSLGGRGRVVGMLERPSYPAKHIPCFPTSQKFKPLFAKARIVQFFTADSKN
jgi:hypothetical protein